MIRAVLGLALLAGGAWYLLGRQPRAFGTSGVPYQPTQGAFDDSGGVPLLGDWWTNRQSHELSDGRLNLGWLDDWLGAEDDTDHTIPGISDTLDWSIFDMAQPRGIRNNNPGNIEYTGTRWQGLDDPPSDGRFMRFTAPEYGIRALARVLDTYTNTHGITNVMGIINRWAPSHENPTNAYAEHVAHALGVGVWDEIDVMARRPELVRAIIEFENGEQPYSSATIMKGVRMA
ncbi:hypothetical protein [Halomonas sp. NO4]|uniref:hypothetical protein n=1 Tax=Halomonas sp. NO4 TaxID=2484813 RepID=UPI00196A0EB0|nr:hypothetical protein [Halomonas sp. NO4]